MDRHEPVLRKLCGALGEGGVLIFTAGGLDEPGAKSEVMKGQPIHHATLGIPNLLEVVADSDCVLRHFEFDQWPERHLYLVAQRASAC